MSLRTWWHRGMLSVLVMVGLLACQQRPAGPPAPRSVQSFWQQGPTQITWGEADEKAPWRQAQAERIQGLYAEDARLATGLPRVVTGERILALEGPTLSTWLLKRLRAEGLDAPDLGVSKLLGDGSLSRVLVLPETRHGPELLAVIAAAGYESEETWMRLTEHWALLDEVGPRAEGSWRWDGQRLEARAQLRPLESWEYIEQGGHRYAFTGGEYKAGRETLVEVLEQGVSAAHARLGLASEALEGLTVYVHPDTESKIRSSEDGGSSHRRSAQRVVHVVARTSPVEVRGLMMREAGLMLLEQREGPAGTRFMEEGLGAWIAGGVAGEDLEEWELNLGSLPALDTLLRARHFLKTDTQAGAALYVNQAIRLVGLEKVLAHLWASGVDRWDEAARRAGTQLKLIEEALGRQLVLEP